jgi:WD40 repeat protein
MDALGWAVSLQQVKQRLMTLCKLLYGSTWLSLTWVVSLVLSCFVPCCAVLCCAVQRVSAVSFSPTDQLFATCSDDNTVKVWTMGLKPISKTFTGATACCWVDASSNVCQRRLPHAGCVLVQARLQLATH